MNIKNETTIVWTIIIWEFPFDTIVSYDRKNKDYEN